jgi:GWxTD domain-containing protein
MSVTFDSSFCHPTRLLALLACLALPSPAAAVGIPAPRPARAEEARALVTRAVEHIRRNDLPSRHAAIGELERATELEPHNPEYQLLLGRCYFSAGFVRAARKRFERVVAIAPGDAAGHFGIGQAWRRDWLKFLDPESLRRAIEEFATASRLDSSMVDAWLYLSSLRTEAHDTTGASDAALAALAAAPGRPEPHLAVAATQWRSGRVEQAAAEFRSAIPRLTRSVRERFQDLAPLASERDTMIYNHLPAEGRAEFERRFWVEHDPDLATPENEAQLEYWARVAQAYFLFYDPRHREWDERGEVYVRYGPPERLDYNPLGQRLYTSIGSSQIQYPMNVLVWAYPSLGMTVTMQDRVLSEYYLLPTTTDHDPDPRPDPDSLAHLAVLGTHDLRGVFPMLPPRAQAVKLEGQVVTFEGAAGPRFYAALEAPSTPGDSLQAQIVVMDSTEHEVLRTSRTLAPSACEADRFRVADFAGELPPGDYRVGLSVRAGVRRGSLRLALSVPQPDSLLALSDVVVTCGTPPVAGASVRLDPNPLARVRDGSPLTAYFEIYRLSPGADGEGRFEYVYTVKSLARDPRIWITRTLSPRAPTPSLQASRMETNTGPLRRQFVSVPVQPLPPGRYRLEVQVHDLVSGQLAKSTTEFERVGPDL